MSRRSNRRGVDALAAQVRHDPLDSPRVHPTNASDQVAQPYALNTTSYNGPAYQHWIVTVVGRVSACIAVACRRMGAHLGARSTHAGKARVGSPHIIPHSLYNAKVHTGTM